MALFDTIRGKWKLDDLLIDDGGRVPDLANINGVSLGTGHDGTPNTARTFNGGPVTYVWSGTITRVGDDFEKTSGTSSWSDAKVYTASTFTGGTLSFTIDVADHYFIGLSRTPGNPSFGDIDRAFIFSPSTANANINGLNMASTSYLAGDSFSIEYNETEFRFYKNGGLFYTYSDTAGDSWGFDSQILNVGGSFSGLSFPGNQALIAPPSEWVNSIGGSMSISVWIYPTGSTVTISEAIVEAIDQSGTDAAFSLTINPADEIQFLLYRPGRIPFGIPSGVTVTFNQWVHVAAIWDQENHMLYMWLDGVLVVSDPQPTNYELQTAPNAPLVIGNISILAAPFNGVIDDLVIYGRAITPAEVGELYALGDNFDQVSGPIVDVPPGDISDVPIILQTDGDVLLYQTVDGGEINVTDGTVQMSGGLETAVYLSLFGGNEDDSGRPNDPRNWWGNADEPDPVRHYRSETQYLLKALPLVSSNLRRVEDAVKKDLSWMITEKAASSITVAATIPGLNKIQISVNVVAEGIETDFIFIENWKVEI